MLLLHPDAHVVRSSFCNITLFRKPISFAPKYVTDMFYSTGRATEMDITMIGLQNAGKTSLLRVLAVSTLSESPKIQHCTHND